jgi:hypothetical protein
MAIYIMMSAIHKRKKRNTEEQRNREPEGNYSFLHRDLWINLFWMSLAFGVVAMPRYAPMFVNNLPVTGNEQMIRLPADLGANSLRAVLAWVGQPDVSPFWMSHAPLLEWPALLAFAVGVLVCLWRWRDPRSGVLLASIVLTTIFGAAIWTAAPLYVRYMTAVPAIALLVGVGIQGIKSITQRHNGAKAQRKYGEILEIAVILMVCGQGIWAAGMQPGEAKGRITAGHWEEDALTQAAASLPSGTVAVLAVSPDFGANLPARGELETLMIAHYVAAYGERRTVVVSRDSVQSLKRQFEHFTKPYEILSADHPQ